MLIETLWERVSPSCRGPIASVELVGDEAPLPFERRTDGLSVQLPQRPGGAVLPVLQDHTERPGPERPQARAPELTPLPPDGWLGRERHSPTRSHERR